jgi:hypothetical protein
MPRTRETEDTQRRQWDDGVTKLAAGDGLWGRWRTIQAWELTFEFFVGFVTLIISIILDHQYVVDAMVKLQSLVDIYLIGRLAVLGVHVWKGSQERQLAIQYNEDPPPEPHNNRAD